MPEENEDPTLLMRCSGCRGQLEPSGQEPSRFICSDCGQNFHLVMQLVPVEPLHRPALLESGDNAERRS